MINEILSIVLCFVSGVVVASIVMIILEMRNKINGLQQQINTVSSLQKDIEALFRETNDIRLTLDENIAKWSSEMYRNLDDERNERIRRENEMFTELNTVKDQFTKQLEYQVADVYRYIDSRLDKLEIKLTDNIKNS
jgi:hypothetical protein